MLGRRRLYLRFRAIGMLSKGNCTKFLDSDSEMTICSFFPAKIKSQNGCIEILTIHYINLEFVN